MDKPLLDAVGRILRDRLAEVERSLAASRLTRIERADDDTARLVFGDGSVALLQLPRALDGAPGPQGSPGDQGPQGERGPAGAQGSPGERGVDGLGIAAIVQDMARALTVRLTDGSTTHFELPSGERGPVGERGPIGEPGAPGRPGERGANGVGIDAVGHALDDAETFTILLSNGTKVPLSLPRGAQGERGAPGERGADGVGIEAVIQDEEVPRAFTLRLTNGDTTDIELPTGLTGERGPQGDRGEAGEPGADRFIAAPRRFMDGERVEKNDLLAWGGGILQAIRATHRTPDAEPASYVCVVAGIESLTMVENLETRTFDLTARLTNGIEQVTRIRAMPRFMGDAPRPGERVIRGDQFVKGDWLYTATLDGADPEAVEAGGWRRQHMRGKRGEDGASGARGDPGIGIADVTLDEQGILTVTLTDGSEKFFDAAGLIARVAA